MMVRVVGIERIAASLWMVASAALTRLALAEAAVLLAAYAPRFARLEARVVVSTWGAGFAHTAAGALAERAVRRVVTPALALRDERVRCIMRLADGRRAHGLRHEDGNDECDLQPTIHFARHGRGQIAMASWN